MNGPNNGQNLSPHNGAIFNWMANTDITSPFLLNSSSMPTVTSLVSPFYQANNNPLLHFRLQETKDFLPRDGWELIHQDFGYTDQGVSRGTPNPGEKVSYPYIILYNRYTGVLRMFVNIGLQDGNTTRMSLTFSSGEDHIQTSLLDMALATSDKPLNALDDFRATAAAPAKLSGLSEYQGSAPLWYYADFPMTYDPCTCRTKSFLDFKSTIIEEAHISLTGDITGDILDKTDLNDGKTIQPPKVTPSLFDGLSSMSLGEIIGGVSEKASQSYNSASSLVQGTIGRLETYANYKPGETPKSIREAADGLAISRLELNTLENLLTSSGKNTATPLKFLKDLPYIGFAIGVIDFLATGGKQTPTPQKVSVSPMAVNLTTNLTGSITKELPKRHISLFNPGSNIPSGEKTGNLYPYYNQTMGVMNLWKTPKLEYKNVRYDSSETHFVGYDDAGREEYSFSCSKVNRYLLHLPDDIEYVMNPAAGFNTSNDKLDISASVIIEFSESAADRITFANEGLFHWVNGATAVTPLIPIGCLRNLDLSFKQPEYSPFRSTVARWLWTSQSSTICDENAQVFNQDDYLVSDVASISYVEMPKVYIKIHANLERLDKTPSTQNVLWVGKYKCNVVSKPSESESYFALSNPVGSFPKDLELNSTTEPNPITSNRTAWRTITIKSGTTFSPSQPITIKAGYNIEVEPGVDIPPNVELVIGLPFDCNTVISPKPISSDDCTGTANIYMGNRAFPRTAEEPTERTIPADSWVNALPNPFSGQTVMQYSIGQSGFVQLTVTDALGRQIATLVDNADHPKGTYEVRFGSPELPSGVYYYTLRTGTFVQTKKLVLIK